MNLVVADTTPPRYLVEIGQPGLLHRLFTRILVPGGVVAELRRERTPGLVRAWAEQLPPWIEVREIKDPAGEDSGGLDRGEWEAIQLAREIHADLLLIDERAGASFARELGFAVTGTLGVLVEAARLGLISIYEAIERLSKTSFRSTPDLFTRVRELVRKNR
jgi:predicted nucleic acid-binding protein